MDLSHCLDVNYKVCWTNRLFFHQIKYKNLLTHWLVNFDVVFFIPSSWGLGNLSEISCIMDHTFMEHSSVQISDTIELWNTCMRTTYFQSKLKFFKEKNAWQWEVHFLQLSAVYLWTSLKNVTRFSSMMTCILVWC